MRHAAHGLKINVYTFFAFSHNVKHHRVAGGVSDADAQNSHKFQVGMQNLMLNRPGLACQRHQDVDDISEPAVDSSPPAEQPVYADHPMLKGTGLHATSPAFM
jgi:hypothetical protein